MGASRAPRSWAVTAALVLVVGACSDGTAVTTTHTGDSTTSTAPSTTSTTEAGTSAPPTSTTSTTTIPLVTTFDDRTECDPAAEDLDVLRMQAFVAAYNDRDMDRLLEILKAPEIWDVTAIPHVGDVLSETKEWAEAGWAVGDQLRLVSVHTYRGAGATGQLERRNVLLEAHGLDWVPFGFKVQARRCEITWAVLYGPDVAGVERCDFYQAFGTEYQEAGSFPDHCLLPWEARVYERPCWSHVGRGYGSQDLAVVHVGPIAFLLMEFQQTAAQSPPGTYEFVLVVSPEASGPVSVSIDDGQWDVARLLYNPERFNVTEVTDGQTTVVFGKCYSSTPQYNGGLIVGEPTCVVVRVVDEGRQDDMDWSAAIPFGVPAEDCSVDD